MHTYVRGYVPDDVRAAIGAGNPGSAIRFVASTADVARDGLSIAQDGWDLSAYKRNSLVLWHHDYMGNRPPIGRAEKVWVEDDRLMADVVFDQGDEFAREVERKYRQGFLNAVSVGWDTKQFEPADANAPFGGGKVVRAELLDISAVAIPGDPKALMERQKRALADFGRDLLRAIEPDDADARATQDRQQRAAIPYAKTPLADEGAAWDGPAQMAMCDGAADLRAICAWVETGADPELKQSYKLPHHMAGGEHAAVWRGVAAAMARLMQGGIDIPDGDRRAVYTHLRRHYQDFDKEAPEFRSGADLAALGPAEIRGLFLEGEPDLLPDFFAWADQRAGAAISARNRDRLEQAIGLIQEVLAAAKKEDTTDTTDAGRAADDPLAVLAKAMGLAA